MFNVSCVILEELLADTKWRSKLEAAKTWDEAVKVVEAFCKVKGYKVKQLKP
ncbi:MAG: hypothetical protein QXY74_08180 [Candidatus Bathyarchaeia archaeon]